MRIAIFVFIRGSYSRAAIIINFTNLTSTIPERGRLAARKYGNSVPVGGASMVASPHRSDYPSYAPAFTIPATPIKQQLLKGSGYQGNTAFPVYFLWEE